MNEKPAPKAAALLPVAVFLVLYLVLGIVLEYVLKIEMGFYQIPIVVAFLVALLVACLQNRSVSFDEKLMLMGQGIGDKNIVTMILIFMAAGIFVGVVGRSSAESVAYFLLSIIPSKYSVAVLFVISCFVSTAMGTSVGTITLIVPIALPIAAASGYSLPLCIATVMGGAMFGDNLSFISDTTIAACNGQGCAMKDKFRENFWIALPAALVTLALILILTLGADVHPAELPGYNLIQIIPYVLVLIGGIAGINVFVVLLVGIVSGSIIMLATGATAATDLLVNMGAGASGMFETTMVAILVAAICALIREYGGFDALLYGIKKVFRGKKGEQLDDIYRQFPFWFSESFGQYVGKTDALPFDQHYLLASIAPRYVYVASATGDDWADPASELLSCYAAAAGDKEAFPYEETSEDYDFNLHAGRIGYHRRPGLHYFSREDWNRFIAFFESKQ